jgi:DNA ligase 1
MHAFTQLLAGLETLSRLEERVALLERFFRVAQPPDAAWALWILAGRQGRRVVRREHLRQWVGEETGLADWLVKDSQAVVGDWPETLALVLPPRATCCAVPLAQWVELRLLPLVGAAPHRQQQLMRQAWAELNREECVVWHKLILGYYRRGVPGVVLGRALGGLAGVEPGVMAYRLAGRWKPVAEDFVRLIAGLGPADAIARRYPAQPISLLEDDPDALGAVGSWRCAWWWNGVRAQMVRRAGQTLLWACDGELLAEGYAEIRAAGDILPDGTVLDGELLVGEDGRANRLTPGRSEMQLTPSPASERGSGPAVFMAHDLLEFDGSDWRGRPFDERWRGLEQLMGRAAVEARAGRRVGPGGDYLQAELFESDGPACAVSEALTVTGLLPIASWQEVKDLRARAREMAAEGVLLRPGGSRYGGGDTKEVWWVWKAPALSCLAVLVGARRRSGHAAELFAGFSFAVWREGELTHVATMVVGPAHQEHDALEAHVRQSTTRRQGPVCWVKPERVYELAFDGLTRSARSRSGVVLKAPRVIRARPELGVSEADTVERLLQSSGNRCAATLKDR